MPRDGDLKEIDHILISRTDNIGDVVLTLPLCGILKGAKPQIKIYFLCRKGIEVIPCLSKFVDQVYVWPETVSQIPKLDAVIHVFPKIEIARFFRKKVPLRIGTSHRWYHWHSCNRLTPLGRKNSSLHEAQMNMALLRPLGISPPPLKKIYEYYGIPDKTLNQIIFKEVDRSRFNLILHMKSRGSSKEWRSSQFWEVVKNLPPKEVKIHITGTYEEGKQIKKEIPKIMERSNVNFTAGKFSLKDLIFFISQCDGLLAASTGPLHIASAWGIRSLGLYPANPPISPARWAPLGKQSQYLSEKKTSKASHLEIATGEVLSVLSSWLD